MEKEDINSTDSLFKMMKPLRKANDLENEMLNYFLENFDFVNEKCINEYNRVLDAFYYNIIMTNQRARREFDLFLKNSIQLKKDIKDLLIKIVENGNHIIVHGETKQIKEELKSINGKFKTDLFCGVGWIFKKNELNLEKIENLLLSLDLNNQDEIRIQIEKIKSNSQTEMPEKKHVIPNLNHLKK